MYEDARLLGETMTRAQDRRVETRLPAALRANLARDLGDMLVLELREENANTRTVESRRGMNRKPRNLPKSKGCASEQGSAL